MSQIERVKDAYSQLERVLEEVSDGLVANGVLQEAVDTQIIVNKLVWKLNKVVYGTDTDKYEDAFTRVVRCKDCNKRKLLDGRGFCDLCAHFVKDEHFCSYGERRES